MNKKESNEFNEYYKQNSEKIIEMNKINKIKSEEDRLFLSKDHNKVKFNTDYVNVSYSIDSELETSTLTEYNIYCSKTGNKPKINKMDILPIAENVIELLKHYNTNLKFNTFKFEHDVFINGEKTIEDFENHLIRNFQRTIKHGWKISEKNLIDSMILISKENEYNPVKEYLEDAYKYYCKKPSNSILTELLNTIESDCIYKERYIKKFLLQMVYIACSEENSQISNQFSLILKGNQNAGKSSWLKGLLPDKLKNDYFIERNLDLNSNNARDNIAETITYWLVELGEIAATFKKTELNALKQFITASKDKLRLPYGRTYIQRKRRTALCGSTNDIEFLVDLTGNRRWAVLDCISVNSGHDVDIDMLWGYIYSLYLKNEPYYFSSKEIEELEEDNKRYLKKPEKMLILESFFELFPKDGDGDWFTASEIYKRLEKFNVHTEFKRMTLGRYLKTLNVKFSYDAHVKRYEFFVSEILEPEI